LREVGSLTVPEVYEKSLARPKKKRDELKKRRQ
jgi:hypothetical protein